MRIYNFPLFLHQYLVGTQVGISTRAFTILFDPLATWALWTTPSLKQLSWLWRGIFYSGFHSTSLTWPLNVDHMLFCLCLLTDFNTLYGFLLSPFLCSFHLFSFGSLPDIHTHTLDIDDLQGGNSGTKISPAPVYPIHPRTPPFHFLCISQIFLLPSNPTTVTPNWASFSI